MENVYFTDNRKSRAHTEHYTLGTGVQLAFDRVDTADWQPEPLPPCARPLTVTLCRAGRLAAPLEGGGCTVLAAGQAAVSTNPPAAALYCPGGRYEGVRFVVDLDAVPGDEHGFLAQLGLDVTGIEAYFCSDTDLYCRAMGQEMTALLEEIWAEADYASPGELRYAMVRLFYALLRLPRANGMEAWYTDRQTEIVRQAEALILQDLSVRHTAKELADRFGTSESSFKLYCKGILGEGYLPYFRRKRLEAAADLLTNTNLKVHEIAAMVGYENQGKFAQAFADQFQMTPLEHRRLKK